MHHGDESRALRELPGLGATGRHPNGRLNADDEGEIKIAIAADPAKGVVVIDLGKPTAWVGFTPEQAVEIADLLRVKAWECRGIKPE